MSEPSRIVFLFDVDNTLLDNDRVTEELRRYLEHEVGHERQERYWTIFEQLRGELGYADYLGDLQRYRVEYPRDPHLLTVSHFLIHYPFADRLYPNALEVIEHVKQWGPVVILSDGDVVFQPRKVERSGIFDAVGGNVLIYIHKEQELDDVEQRYPAEHYVLIDDKLRILSAVKTIWTSRVTTVFPRQGHYAMEPLVGARFPPPDVTIARIGDLLKHDLSTLQHKGGETMKRTASAVWRGDLKAGKGTVSTESAVLSHTQYSFGTRFENGKGTNPEELIAAAHAGCFTMALSGQLGSAGLVADKLETKATLSFEKLEAGWTVTQIHLDVKGKVPKADQAAWEKATAAAKAGCPISRLLNTTITMDAKLEA